MRVVIGLFCALSLLGCEKRNGDAVVLTREHIDAAPSPTETPGQESHGEANQPDPISNETRPMRDDEIAVDSYVMKREVRGTSRDPRASSYEQWLVKVRTVDSGRTFNVSVKQSQFDKLKEGDHVHVRYRTGKYTGTVWTAEIEEK